MKVKILNTELKVGNLKKTITSVNILPFRYVLYGDGINVTCQLCDDKNCICFEENIFINKDKLNLWSDDSFIVNELLIRLGVKEYTENEQGKKDISK